MRNRQGPTTSKGIGSTAQGLKSVAQDGGGRLLRCLSLDLEVTRDHRIHALAGVRPDTGQRLTLKPARRGLAKALARLDDLAAGAEFVLGHNLIDFDLPRLRCADPGLRLLRLPAVDTLRLNPLAFPRNPYHHLVKDYQDGQLKRGRVNDPELDARLTLKVFDNQQRELLKADPDLLAALALADQRERRCWLRQSVCVSARLAKAVGCRGTSCDSQTTGWQHVPDTCPRGDGWCGPRRLGSGLCISVAVGVRR